MRYGYGVERASLHFQGRAWPSNLIGSGMYREVWDCRKTDLEARQRLCTGILVDETRRAPGSVGIYGPLSCPCQCPEGPRPCRGAAAAAVPRGRRGRAEGPPRDQKK